MTLRDIENISFQISEWTDADFSVIRKNTVEISSLATKAGNSSDRFQDACDSLWSLARRGQGQAIPNKIKSSIDVRALSFLLKDDLFLKHVAVTIELLDSLYLPSLKLGRLSLLQLIEVFFKQFDKIGDVEVLEHFVHLISSEISRIETTGGTDELSRLGQYRERLFTLKGPQNVVDFALQESLDLDQALNKLALHGYHGGRFQNLCRFQYYLETLRNIPVGDDHSVLTEVCKPDVYKAPAGEDRLIGHEILKILIDRAHPKEISDSWRQVIMTIAGDPRVPKNSRRYQDWWYLLGLERIQKVRSWLSRVDLLLFLDILEEYGNSTGQDDLKRMFPARKAFLEGLHRQGLIFDSRLFISSSAERHVKRNYRSQDVPEYARVSDPYRSIIYLKVGDYHLIEGSHSFKLWIFKDLPEEASIFDPAVKRFTPRELSYELEDLCLQSSSSHPQHRVSIVHNPHNFSWQASAIYALRYLGVQLDLEQLFSEEDYREYKWKHGL